MTQAKAPTKTYRYSEAQTNDPDARMPMLNHYGSRGWRVVREVVQRGVHRFTFEREALVAPAEDAGILAAGLRIDMRELRRMMQDTAEENRATHVVPVARVRDWIEKIDDIMNPKPEKNDDDPQ